MPDCVVQKAQGGFRQIRAHTSTSANYGLTNEVRLLFLQAHRETDRFFAASGVQLAQHDRGQFHYKRAAFSS